MMNALNRRELLGAGVLGVGILVAPQLRVGTSGPEQMMVFRQDSVPESVVFADALIGGTARASAMAVGQGLEQLLDEWPLSGGIMTGLTADPVAMIVQQLLVERGAEPLLWWDHSFSAGRWAHSVPGELAVTGAMPGDWPAAVARHMLRTLTGTEQVMERETCFGAPCVLAGDSPGRLVSFALRLKGDGQ